MTERPDPAERKRVRARRAIVALGGASLLVAFGSILHHNNVEASRAETITDQIARDRNTCQIQSAVAMKSRTGGSQLAISISLSPGTKDPSDYSKQLDKFGVDVNFSDEYWDSQSGVVVYRKNQNNDQYSTALDDDSSEDSAIHANRIVVSPPLLLLANAEYHVYHRNTVSAEVSGPFVRSMGYVGTALVSCGIVTYDPKKTPVIITTSGG